MVDAILETRSGDIGGMEIKNSENVMPDDFKGLKHLKEKTWEIDDNRGS